MEKDKAEHVSTSSYISYAIWLKNLFKEIQVHEATKIYIDNKFTINLAKNPIFHERIKHIDVCLHSMREHMKEKEVEVVHAKSHNQVVDIFTKSLKIDHFYKLKTLIRVIDRKKISLRKVLYS